VVKEAKNEWAVSTVTDANSVAAGCGGLSSASAWQAVNGLLKELKSFKKGGAKRMRSAITGNVSTSAEGGAGVFGEKKKRGGGVKSQGLFVHGPQKKKKFFCLPRFSSVTRQPVAMRISTLVRAGARSFSGAARLPPHQLIPMPKFSPSMTKARVTKWFKEEGSEVTQCELIFEAEMFDLTDGAFDNSLVRLIVESHEDGFLAKVFHSDEFVAEGTPIGVMCEEKEDIAAFADFEQPSSVETNEIDFLWQAYASKEQPDGASQ
jgi:hypothetical protein